MATLLSAPLTPKPCSSFRKAPVKVVLFNSASSARHTVIDVGAKPHEIESTPDGRTAFVSNFGLLEGNHKIGTPDTTISFPDLEHRAERRAPHRSRQPASPRPHPEAKEPGSRKKVASYSSTSPLSKQLLSRKSPMPTDSL
jgi:hypothetical protein